MKYNFLMDAYEEEYSAFVTDFSKYEVINDLKKEEKNLIREIEEEEMKMYPSFEDAEFEIKDEYELIPTKNEEDVQGFVLDDYKEETQKQEEDIFENNWMLEMQKAINDESLENISAQLTNIDDKLGRICSYLEKIFNLG